MPPFYDARPQLGDAPALHALIVGVSSYPYLVNGPNAVADPWDMGQLTSTASSAFKIYEWLRAADAAGQLPVRLGTCRILLSPAAGEGHLAGLGTPPGTLEKFEAAVDEWRQDCRKHRDHVGFFYFAGHGVQRNPEDAVLCLEDFRRTPGASLKYSVSLANIRGGMAPAPDFENIARTQLYFVDACRVRPDRFSEFEEMSTTDVFDVSLAAEDDRSSPIFYASISNRPTGAVPGGQTLFSRAVLDCLKGEASQALEEDDAGSVPWAVTVNSLNERLDTVKMNEINRDFGADQKYAPGGQFRERIICKLPGPPPVRFSLDVQPPEACRVGHVKLSQATGVVVDVEPPLAQPYDHPDTLPGGFYRLEVWFDSDDPKYQKVARDVLLRPVRWTRTFQVG